MSVTDSGKKETPWLRLLDSPVKCSQKSSRDRETHEGRNGDKTNTKFLSFFLSFFLSSSELCMETILKKSRLRKVQVIFLFRRIFSFKNAKLKKIES